MKSDILKQIDGYKEGIIQDISNLVMIPSYLKEEEVDAYPTPIMKSVLEKALAIFEREGFKTFMDDEGYYGYADIGEGEELIGILGHLDVVPPGDLEQWETEPFKPVFKENKLYGRGTQDDKGPIIASMYALKALIDSGVAINKRIRFILGTDEETLWRGINVYNQKEETPAYGFTPDSAFPLTYAEKGLVQIDLSTKNYSGIILKGGDAYNSVPSKITYDGRGINEIKSYLNDKNHEYELHEDSITVLGKSVHSASCHKGINAICRLVDAMYHANIKSPIINFLHECVGHDPHARNLFGDISDETSGNLTFNVGKIDLNENEESVALDIRIPVGTTIDEVLDTLKQASDDYQLDFHVRDRLGGIHVPLESKIVTTLMQSYQEMTGDFENKPKSSGGATYARALKNCVAYGAVFPGKPKVEHQPNEFVDLEDLMQASAVYALALYNLILQ